VGDFNLDAPLNYCLQKLELKFSSLLLRFSTGNIFALSSRSLIQKSFVSLTFDKSSVLYIQLLQCLNLIATTVTAFAMNIVNEAAHENAHKDTDNFLVTV
jgi:hypothetical protein